MTSLAFPDVNVWLALIVNGHMHRRAALDWWESTSLEVIAFSRFTQIGVLRLLTTAAMMNNRPLTMSRAWEIYDRLFEDDRIALLPEPAGLEPEFRKHSAARHASPKLWADAYMIGFASGHEGALVTFDRALARRSAGCVLLG